MKKLACVVILVGCLMYPVNVRANSYYNGCYGGPCGYLMVGIVAGMVAWEAYQRYEANQIPPDRSGYCPDERYPDGRLVQLPSQAPVVAQQYQSRQRYFKKVWIPGSLQLRCDKGYYNFFGNFVPPDCVRVWVPGFWQLR